MIVRLDKDETREEKLGNKGKFLLQMKKNGFEVPGGFILDSDVYMETIRANGLEERIGQALKHLTRYTVTQVSKEIRELFAQAALPAAIAEQVGRMAKDGQLYAVRSSGTKEDLDQYSFAGQYETFLNVRKEELCEKIMGCYQSLFGEVVLHYLADHPELLGEMAVSGESRPANAEAAGGDEENGFRMSVVVQEMVPAEYSGICFTVNPVTGADKEMLMEVSEGLGENIVSGKTRPEQYFYDWYEQEECRRQKGNRFWTTEEVKQYGEIFADVQQFFGYPCDIEFAVQGGKLYVLQARRITRIRYNGIEDMWSTADFKDGGVSATVCTPYMWSLYEYIWEYSLRRFIVGSDILKDEDLPRKLGNMFYGRPYWNMSAVKKAMSQIIGYKEREFDNEYGIIGNYEGDGETTKVSPQTLTHMLKIVVQQTRILNHRRKNAEKFKSELLEHYETYKTRYDRQEIGDIRKDFYHLTKKVYLRSETTYFWQIFINTIHQSLYKDSLLKYVSESEYLSLLGGIDNISHLLPFYEMWDLSRKIRSEEEVYRFWKETEPGKIAEGSEDSDDIYRIGEAKQILERYGYHSDKELDITYPCYYEEPEVVIGMIRDMVLLEDSYSPVEDKEKCAGMYEEVLAHIEEKVSPGNFKRIRKKVANMRNMLWWREEFRDVSTRFYYLLRVYTIEYAKSLQKKGVLENWEDVWFLKVGNLWDHIEHRTTARELQETIRKNKKYYRAYRNYMSENEIGTVFSQMAESVATEGVTGGDHAADKGIQGLGANNGKVTGVARVIRDFSEIDRLKEGDILVTRFTDTGWTPKFAILSGIVTEYGGILCHAAIVSREYGIPAIVCCKDAMKKIRDGQIITVDGTTGTVTIGAE